MPWFLNLKINLFPFKKGQDFKIYLAFFPIVFLRDWHNALAFFRKVLLHSDLNSFKFSVYLHFPYVCGNLPHYGWENVVLCCAALLHCTPTDLIQQNIQLANCIVFFLSFYLMQDSFLGVTISILFWCNSHLSPLLTNCRHDCHSSFGFRCSCISDISFDLSCICRLKYL